MICSNRKTRVFDLKGHETTIARQSDICRYSALALLPRVLESAADLTSLQKKIFPNAHNGTQLLSLPPSTSVWTTNVA